MFILLVLVALSTSVLAFDAPAPSFTVSLDVEPSQRWKEPVSYMIDTYGFDYSFQGVVDYIDTILPPKLLTAAEPMLLKILGSFPDEYAAEIKGIWNTLDEKGYGDRLTLGQLAGVNLMYELTVFCTSILAEDEDGNIYHGRNLDYGIHGLQNLTAQIDFTRGNEVVYTGTEFVGYVGLLTGMKPGAFSFSVDQREMIDQHKNNFPKFEIFKGIVENIIAGVEGGKPVGMFLRKELAEEGTSFSEALESVKSVHLIAPVYIMLAGLESGSGVVVTRDRLKPDDSVGEGVWPIDAKSGSWWRLETNYDHWVDTPETDNRRDPANECMENVGYDKVDLNGIYSCLSTPPVLAPHTIYTTLMRPSTSDYSTTIRNQEGAE